MQKKAENLAHCLFEFVLFIRGTLLNSSLKTSEKRMQIAKKTFIKMKKLAAISILGGFQQTFCRKSPTFSLRS